MIQKISGEVCPVEQITPLNISLLLSNLLLPLDVGILNHFVFCGSIVPMFVLILDVVLQSNFLLVCFLSFQFLIFMQLRTF